MEEDQKKAQIYAQKDLAELYQEFSSSPIGLTAQVAADRLQQNGLNTIQKIKRQPEWQVFLKNFVSLMACLLWVSGLIAFFSGTTELGIAIWCVNLINGLFSYYQQHAAQKATDSMLKMLPNYTQVIRDGKQQQIDASQIVVGDVFLLNAGDAIPADARLLETNSLQIDESALTGESVPATKNAVYQGSDSDQLSANNLVYAGTSAVNGSAKAIVFATGMKTEFGKIAQLTHQQKKNVSPLQLELNRLTKQLSIISLSIGAAFFVASIFFVHYPPAQAFIFALGMIVAFIPEGLLPTVTLSLAQGVRRMAQKHALVKELNSIETLGEATVICSDKTGTLTQNQMTINHLWTPEHDYQITGEGYEVNGQIMLDQQPADLKDPDLQKMLEVMVLDNEAKLQTNSSQQKQTLGTPTERALLIAALKSHLDLQQLAEKLPKLQTFPFDSIRKRMSTVHQLDSKQQLVLVKGALSETLPLCSQIQENGQVKALTAELRQRILAANAQYAASGLRSLCLSYKKIPSSQQVDLAEAESDLIFVGLAVMMDPPRPEVYQAVKKCHQAKIKIIMVTGDRPLTAKAVAVKIGITGPNPQVVTGEQLEKMSAAQLKEVLKGDVIFARVAPEHKYRIVLTLQQCGQVVASTGDGVNDAPALKKADIGVAMGKLGTDVAKDAADMILTDDNFASIVAAIEEGRAVYSNIQKFLLYILNSNVPEAFPSVLFLFSGGLIPLPLTVMQILTVDLGTDMLPALGLGAERAEPDVMQKPPRSRQAHLLKKSLIWKAFGWYGLLASLISTFAYFYTNYVSGWPGKALAASGSVYLEATTMTLAAIVFCQIAAVLNCRTENTSVFKIGLFSNHQIWIGIIFEILLLSILIYLPFLQGVFNTTAIGVKEWLFLIAIPIPIFLLEELRKFISRHFQRT
ncbi:cation-translocating P-type ATPase [Liquorilactobacillus sicerae]|uniref:cation-translocating P-type ATPase n=1 Tax=Liquorilactobacillus sicerae TaxID=1416943 RepID=UPI00248115CE|nr:cation-transporting P-type ATPase [Liquorilactobacillus sicerae]